MCSKKKNGFTPLAAMSLAALAVSVAGCFSVGPTGAPSAPVTIAAVDTQCLNVAGAQVEQYVSGDPGLGDAGVNTFWDCVDRSITLFQTRVQGVNPDFFTPDEVRKFVVKYFLPGSVISDRFLADGMKLKALIFGGTSDRFAVSEFNSVHNWIALLRKESLSFRPWVAYVLGSSKLTPTSAQQAADTLAPIFQGWGAVLQSNGVAIPFQLLSDLCDDISGFVTTPGLSDTMATAKTINQWMSRFKGDFMAGDPSMVVPADWPQFMTISGRAVRALLKYDALAQAGLNWLYGDGKDQFVSIVLDGVSLLHDLIAGSPAGVWSFDKIDAWIDAAPLSGLPPSVPIDAPALKDTVRALFQYALRSGPLPASGALPTGITPSNMDEATRAFKHWSFGQSYIDALYAYLAQAIGHSDSDGMGYTPGDLLSVPLEQLATVSPLFAGVPDPSLADAIARVRHLIATDRPLFVGDDPEMSFPTSLGDRNSHANLSMNYLWHEAIQEVLDGYGAWGADGSTPVALDFDQFDTFYFGYKKIGTEMKIFGPAADQLVIQRFTEANLFTYAANGDDALDIDEGAQLAQYLWSAKSLSGRIFTDMSSYCAHGPTDVYGNASVEINCYKRTFFNSIDHIWDRLPGMLAYYKSLTGANQTDFENKFMAAALGATTSAGAWVGSGDTDGVAMVGYYVEALFSRFDADHSGTFEVPEAAAAFPVFKGVLKTASGLGDGSLFPLFTYALANGQPPTKDLWGGLSFLMWEIGEPFWNIHANRTAMVSVFGTLGSGT